MNTITTQKIFKYSLLFIIICIIIINIIYFTDKFCGNLFTDECTRHKNGSPGVANIGVSTTILHSTPY